MFKVWFTRDRKDDLDEEDNQIFMSRQSAEDRCRELIDDFHYHYAWVVEYD